MTKLKKRKFITPITSALLTIATGIVLVAVPSIAIELVCALFGGLLLIYSVIGVVDYLFVNKHSFTLVTGLLNLLLGVTVLLIAPAVIRSDVFALVIGIIYVVRAYTDFQDSIAYRRAGSKLWWIKALFALGKLIVAVLLIFASSNNSAIIVFGIALMIDGVGSMTVYLTLTRHISSLLSRQSKPAYQDLEYEISDSPVDENDNKDK